MVVIHAVSPLDRIPDFIVGVGYRDDLIIPSFGIILAVKMIPADVM